MMFLGTRKCWNVFVAKLVPPLPSIIPTFAPLDGTFVLSDIICAPAEPLFPRWRADCFLDHVGPYRSWVYCKHSHTRGRNFYCNDFSESNQSGFPRHVGCARDGRPAGCDKGVHCRL